ncbi:MAG TPA: phosphate ABC transporter substrate-binding protein [Bacteroidales bacterium]|jgi:phosphate transport system substrate-binding protein|nr:phosphate ABC transporter substrate-binding protein [Bacteroidales bacterium]HBZ20836.1 phosphate ABC transporter substrate-binding protein [Bacteroidales bacterium]
MNKKIIMCLLLILVLVFSINPKPAFAQEKLKGTISLSGAWALYPMAVRWAEEFRKINPEVRIDLSAGGAGKGITDALNDMVDLGMVSREIYKEELTKGAYPVAVTKDAVVPVINASNPYLDILLGKGLKKEGGSNIWVTGMYKTWAQAFGIKSTSPIHVYTRSDACGAAEVWAKYFGKKQEDLLGSGVYGDPGLALAVKKDALGIGYNNIGYAYDSKTKKQLAGIRVLPIDINNDGKITPDENFYDSMDDLINAIANGKYPSPPARELYFVSHGKPQKEVVTKFLEWVLTDGQKYVNESGYITLSKEKVAGELKKIQ